MKNNKSMRMQPNFKSASLFILGLAVVNLIIIFLNDYFHCRAIMFFGNVIAIGLLFPATLLYTERKEKFNLYRYLYFVLMTMIASAILMYLFVYRF